jgi:chitinase
VPLENLFPDPPKGPNIDIENDLKIDGNHENQNPSGHAFGFYIMASPEEIQVSVDRRDGSNWFVYDCHDAVSEEQQTVRMFCTDLSDKSNCGKIYLGKGVPGTILQMPEGCGPGKYAVAKSMIHSQNQTLPPHLAKRAFGYTPVVYDLTFDYEWSRVPQDFGSTQMRIDYSNEEVSEEPL